MRLMSLYRAASLIGLCTVLALAPLGCEKKQGTSSTTKQRQGTETAATVEAAKPADAPEAPKVAAPASMKVMVDKNDIVVTLEGMLSAGCNAVISPEKKDDSGMAAPPDYKINGSEISVAVYEYYSEDESCVITAPTWQREIRIPNLKKGNYRIVATGSKLAETVTIN